MDPRLDLIAQSFDLKKLDRRCNEKNCGKIPSKRTLIFELNELTAEKKELVMLHLCTKHFESLERFLRELGELTEKDKTIGTKVFETGYVTY